MRLSVLVSLALVVPMTSGCFFGEDEPIVLRLSGETMGTTYNVVAVDVPEEVTETELSVAVEETLARVNSSMSNWDKDSEVSRFNRDSGTEPFEVSAEFAHVMAAANEVHALSEGKFDVTLFPLIELWGFGAKKPGEPIPSDAEIEAALENVGQADLVTLDGQMLQKAAEPVSVNLSAIAKGYGNDAVAETLRGFGIERYLVEIGGDLVATGQNDKGEPWKIGIETPDAGSTAVEMILPVSDLGMATSGDYRNFFEEDGVRYSHLIDPTTGRPITHRATSVTVLAENGMMADALATAMMVLGEVDGMRVAEANDLAVFFISRAEAGADEDYVKTSSPAFEKLREKD
ncbi:thiamine biosynthesis lipoprotein [Aliiruegeria haliotis]|uniref:FAD:protein FMN transferase n=1 Tax=Aliiruegeria haliotis TaxID=1280846 RepID=A0A2T0RZT5_9RHOB|nr:FAD:protein FMN transferase [Aliiruegeria haliotis]PRY26684.1 thiamine biosynthesis lipoprotein [Aliiruegeria haliotis]